MVHTASQPPITRQHSTNQAQVEHWFIRYKLYHIPFWMTYQYLWWTLRIGSPLEVASAIVSTPAATCKYLFYVAFQTLGVCFNLYVLMPRLLDKGRYAAYVVGVLLTVILCAWCIVGGYYVGALLSDKTFQEFQSCPCTNSIAPAVGTSPRSGPWPRAVNHALVRNAASRACG